MNKKWFLFSNENNRAKRLLSLSISDCLIEKNKNFVRSKLPFTTSRGNFMSSPVFQSVSRNIECQSYFENRKTNDTFSSKKARTSQAPAAGQGESLSPFKESVPLMQKNQSEYKLETFVRSNQDTCLTHKPSVFEGDWVQSGDFLTDCANSVGGELSLGQNIFIAYMPWEGYNFEDAILISERLVTDDLFTSVHIERYEIENLQKNRPPVKLQSPDGTPTSSSHKKLFALARTGAVKPHRPQEKLRKKNLEESLQAPLEKTSLRTNDLETNVIPKPRTKKSKLSTPSKVSSTSRTPRYEEITRNIPDVSAIELSNLDAFGIIKVGSFVQEGDILVGKISPIKKKEFTPYQKLLYTILNKPILPYRDSSLRAPKGIQAKVIDLKIFMKPGTVSYSSKVLYNNHSVVPDQRPEGSFIPSSLIEKKFKSLKPKFESNFSKMDRQKKKLNQKYMGSTVRKRNSLSPQENLSCQFSSAPVVKPKVSRDSPCFSEKNTVTVAFFEEKHVTVTNKIRSFLLNSSNLNFLVPFSKKASKDKKSMPIHPVSSLLARKANHIKNGLVVPSSFPDYIAPQENLQSPCSKNTASLEKPKVSRKRRFSSVRLAAVRSPTVPVFFKEKHGESRQTEDFSTVPSFSKKKATDYFHLNKYAVNKITPRVFQRKTRGVGDFRRKKHYKRNQSHRRYLWQTQKKSILVRIADSKNVKQLKNVYKNDILFQKHPLLKQQQLYDYQSIKNIETIHIYLAEKRKVQVGDKMSGRHGNKGIVSQILPIQDMPFLPDGTAIDMVLNPLGVPSRMNVGQIYECLLGLAGRYLGENYKVFAFDEIYGAEASRSFVFNKLYEASCKTGFKWLFNPQSPGKIRLFDGRSGDCFDQPVTVGQAYMLRLVHMVDDKIHMRSTGPYSLVTQQPLRGRSKQGGQRLGEMEVWALEGYGAAFTLLEMLTVKSDDLTGRMTLWSNLILNKDLTIGTPEAFKVLICELQALCLDIGLFRYNTNHVRVFEENAEISKKIVDFRRHDIFMKKGENKTLEDRPLFQSPQTKSLKEMTSLMSFP